MNCPEGTCKDKQATLWDPQVEQFKNSPISKRWYRNMEPAHSIASEEAKKKYLIQLSPSKQDHSVEWPDPRNQMQVLHLI